MMYSWISFPSIPPSFSPWTAIRTVTVSCLFFLPKLGTDFDGCHFYAVLGTSALPFRFGNIYEDDSDCADSEVRIDVIVIPFPDGGQWLPEMFLLSGFHSRSFIDESSETVLSFIPV